MSTGALLLLLVTGTASAATASSPATTAPPAHHCPDLLGAAHAPRVGATVARGDGGGLSLELEVLSVHPPVWRVAGFLSAAESDWYVGRAERRMSGGGLGASGVLSGDGAAAESGRRIEPYRDVWQAIDGMREAGTQEAAAAAAADDGGGGEIYPRSFDGSLFHAAVRTVTDASLLSAAHSQQLLRTLDADGDGRVAEAEWDDGGEAGGSARWGAFHGLMRGWRESEPHIFTRFSQSGWEAETPPGSALAARVAAVLGIPAARLPATSDDAELWGELTQVLRYAPKGHYVSLVARPAATPTRQPPCCHLSPACSTSHHCRSPRPCSSSFSPAPLSLLLSTTVDVPPRLECGGGQHKTRLHAALPPAGRGGRGRRDVVPGREPRPGGPVGPGALGAARAQLHDGALVCRGGRPRDGPAAGAGGAGAAGAGDHLAEPPRAG